MIKRNSEGDPESRTRAMLWLMVVAVIVASGQLAVQLVQLFLQIR